MKKIFFTILFFLNFNIIYAVETKIIYIIQNEIITNVDIKNEFKYLLALNPKLENLDKEKIFKISKDSIIREKIKKIELLKNFSNLRVGKKYTDNLIKKIYTSLNFENLEEFDAYLETYNQNVNDIIKKITIDALWNELIVQKYNSKIEINENTLGRKILNKGKDEITQYNLSEIVYVVKEKQNIEKKYLEIKKSISEIGFENSASIYSDTETSKIGGNIGWVSQESLNQKIMQSILKLGVNEISKPIIISNGILILKVNEIKKVLTKVNYNEELKKLIIYERNRKLDQYSKIHFNKIKKNISFNE